MYIEQKFYDNGKAYIRLSSKIPEIETKNDECDYYADEIDDLQEWIEDNLEIELDDIIPFVIDLENRKWVDITNFI